MGFINDPTGYIRRVVDPLILNLRREIYGSGIAYNTVISTTVLPSIVVTQNNITNVVNNIVLSGAYMKGFTVYNNGLLIGSGYTSIEYRGTWKVTGAGTNAIVDDSFKISRYHVPAGETVTISGRRVWQIADMIQNEGTINIVGSGVVVAFGRY